MTVQAPRLPAVALAPAALHQVLFQALLVVVIVKADNLALLAQDQPLYRNK